MKNKTFLILGLTIILLITIFFLTKQPKELKPLETAVINGQEFSLENAINPADQQRGLSFRLSLCENCGMIFLFPNYAKRSFVMRNMGFPLDIIFIKNQTVTDIYKNLPPEGLWPEKVYSSAGPIDKVLELNAGQASRLNLKIGDKVSFK